MYLTTYLRTLSVLRYKQLLQRLPLKRQQSYTPFVVLCHPRSGSTLLHTYLNSHTAIISKGEQAVKDLREASKIIDKNYLQQKIFHLQPTPIEALGIKFFVSLVKQPEGKYLFRRLVDIPNLKVILLKRKNPLRTIVSSKIADKTGQMSVWTKAQSLTIEDRRIHLPPEECLSQLDQMKSEFVRAEKLVTTSERLTIYYEDLVSRKEETLGQVQQFLQISPQNLFSLLRQQNPEPLHELIRNYDELAEGLSDSPWAELLHEQ